MHGEHLRAMCVAGLAFAGVCRADLTFVSQVRSIAVTTSWDGQTTELSAPDFGPFDAVVSRSIPVVVEGRPGRNAGTTDISCHFDRTAISARARMLGEGVIGESTQVTASGSTVVDVTFENTEESTYRLFSAGFDVAAVGVNDVHMRFTSLDSGAVIFEQRGSNIGSHQVGTIPAGRYRFEFLARQVSAVGECGREYEVHLDVPAVACEADFDDGTFSGTRDGGVTIEDLVYYLEIYDQGDVRADLDDGSGRGGGHPDGAITIDDLLYFLERYEIGC
jgi:hypothetical protein